MSHIARLALIGAIRMLLGSDYWDKVREVVRDLSNEDLPGEEKRAMAISVLREGGWRATSWLLNLGIEIAVGILTDKLEEAERNLKDIDE